MHLKVKIKFCKGKLNLWSQGKLFYKIKLNKLKLNLKVRDNC